MGQKTNPISNRLGIIKGWESNWYGGNDYADKLIEDEKIRKYILKRIEKGGISKIIIERAIKQIIITIYTARPGIIIGKGGKEVEQLREELKKITSQEVQINIAEVKRSELDARLVGENIARQIESRVSYKRAIKMAIASTMRMAAEGIKVVISGRLGGHEIARTESFHEGKVPLHTFRADIDYANVESHTVYGIIGIKCWICKGEIIGKRDLSPNVGQGSSPAQKMRNRKQANKRYNN